MTNTANNAVGIMSNDRPYSLPIWSTPATGLWGMTPYDIVYQQPITVHGCTVACDPPPVVIPDVATPEPGYLPLLVTVAVLTFFVRWVVSEWRKWKNLS